MKNARNAAARPGSSRRRKALGQNFLRNLAAADQIVAAFAPRPGEPILEIGPGHGVLTSRLLAAGALVVAVEMDGRLAAKLRERFRDRALREGSGDDCGTPSPAAGGPASPPAAGLRVVTGDARVVDLDGLLGPHLAASDFPKARVLANLPYSVGTEIVSRFLMAPGLFSSITVMLQREVADRICSPPGSRVYGSLSVLAQYFARPRMVMRLAPGSFEPPPKVHSAVVEMPLREDRELQAAREAGYPRFIRTLFQHRRRTLPHNLVEAWGIQPNEIASRLAAIGIDPGRRPETLTREECLRVYSAADRQD